MMHRGIFSIWEEGALTGGSLCLLLYSPVWIILGHILVSMLKISFVAHNVSGHSLFAMPLVQFEALFPLTGDRVSATLILQIQKKFSAMLLTYFT